MKTVKCKNCGTENEIELDQLADLKKSIDLDLKAEYRRRVTELEDRLERNRIEIREQAQNESSLKIKEKEKLIADLKDQLTKGRQKLENSSQQIIGEIQELELEAILTATFPNDLIEPVAKGVNGADCTQYVRTKSGVEIEKILFESKRVKTFSDGWIDKLKTDNLQAKCDLTVIVTSTMPKEIQGKFGVMDGVWICLFEPEAIKQLALVLRYGLIKVFEVTQKQNSSDTKSEKLYQYLTSAEFKNLFENVLKGFDVLEKSFQDEKKRMATVLKMRELHLQEMLESTLEFYSNIKSISSEIPDINFEYRQVG